MHPNYRRGRKLLKEVRDIAAPAWSYRQTSARSRNAAQGIVQARNRFRHNIVKANAPVMFTKADLDGYPTVSRSPGIKTGDDVCTDGNVTAIQYGRGKRKERSDAQAALPYSRDARQRPQCSCPQQNARAPQQDRTTPWLKSWTTTRRKSNGKTGANAEKYINDLVAGSQPENR